MRDLLTSLRWKRITFCFLNFFNPSWKKWQKTGTKNADYKIFLFRMENDFLIVIFSTNIYYTLCIIILCRSIMLTIIPSFEFDKICLFYPMIKHVSKFNFVAYTESSKIYCLHFQWHALHLMQANKSDMLKNDNSDWKKAFQMKCPF